MKHNTYTSIQEYSGKSQAYFRTVLWLKILREDPNKKLSQGQKSLLKLAREYFTVDSSHEVALLGGDSFTALTTASTTSLVLPPIPNSLAICGLLLIKSAKVIPFTIPITLTIWLL